MAWHVVVNNNRFRVRKSKCLYLSILTDEDGNEQNEELKTMLTDLPEFATSDVFSSYVKSSLLGLPLATGQLIGISWKAKSIILQVKSLLMFLFVILLVHFVSYPLLYFYFLFLYF